MTTGRVHAHLDIFENEIEPKLKINRRSGGRTFRILGHFWLAFLVLETTRGVVYFVPGTWESFVEFCVFLTLEVVILMHFIPDMLLYRTTGRWLLPLIPLIRIAMFVAWPARIFLEGGRVARADLRTGIRSHAGAADGRGHRSVGRAGRRRRHHRAGAGFADRASRGVQRQARARSHDAAPRYRRHRGGCDPGRTAHEDYRDAFCAFAGVRALARRYFWRREFTGFAADRGF